MIIYFSGTGNSAYVAQQLSELLNDKIVSITATVQDEIKSDVRIIWVFPIYSWGVPPVVKSVIETIWLKTGLSHYMVCTCGDDIGNAHHQWRRLINRRGWNAVASYSVIMPNTYTLMKGFDVDNKELEQRKLNEAPARISYIAERITQGIEEDNVMRGAWAWVKTAVIYPYFVKFCMSPRPFHYTEKCVGCGLCSRECPMQNIVMNNGKPQWGNNCAMCLRCYHVCPVHSVAYGKKTIGKGQYLCPLKK